MTPRDAQEMIALVNFEVEFRNTHGQAASIGSAGPYTLVVDRPADAGGQGLGFNGGQLLYLAIEGCVSNDFFREASTRGIRLTQVRVRVAGEFDGDPAVSQDVSYDVQVAGAASREQLEELVSQVDAIAEIPNSLRRGTSVKLRRVEIALSLKPQLVQRCAGAELPRSRITGRVIDHDRRV